MDTLNLRQTELASELRKAIARAVLFNEYVAHKVGMSGSEMQTIHLLQLYGPLTPGQLCSLTSLKSNSITAVLDRLEKLGFVTRNPHPTDRRKVIVHANEERIASTLAPYYAEKAKQLQDVVKRLTDEEVKIITRFLQLLNTQSHLQ